MSKPWLDGLPRLIFVSDMSDALSDIVPFEYLRMEIIDNVTSPLGSRHQWQWLTKRTGRMAKFSKWLQEQQIEWPANLWAGTSITTMGTTNRIDDLLDVGNSDTIRFLSAEPQWEALDLMKWLPRLDWVIQGGESGGSQAKNFDIAWVEDLRRQCRDTKTPYFLKQLGSRVFRSDERIRLRDGHGGDWSEWPKHLRVRQMPIYVTKRKRGIRQRKI